MPVDFDDEDISDVIEEVDSPQAQIMPEPEADIDDLMSEAEARMEVASYYRLILRETLFGDDDPNPQIADQVQQEIRKFCQTRMAALMGVGQIEQKAAKIFTDSEVQTLRTLAQSEVSEALKALAAKVLKKPTILEARPLPAEKPKAVPKAEPVLRKIGQKPRPQAAPVAPQRVGKQKKQYKTVTTEDGREVRMDMTPQAKPVGAIQPIPTPRSKSQIEAMSAQSAYQQAQVAVGQLERKLSGKG